MGNGIFHLLLVPPMGLFGLLRRLGTAAGFKCFMCFYIGLELQGMFYSAINSASLWYLEVWDIIIANGPMNKALCIALI